MGINKKVVEKFTKAYEGIPATKPAIEFMEGSPYYHQEEWREVLQMFVPGVLPGMYFISNMGRVYTKVRSPLYPNGGIMKHSINPKGYHQINLQSVDGKKIGIKITKLVMLHFRFVPGCEYLEVDHLDGDKDNNCLWNYQWVKPRENTRRAIVNNQRTISNRVNSYYTKSEDLLTYEQAECLYIEAYNRVLDGLSLEPLCVKYNVTFQYIRNILDGRCRPYFRKKYNGGPYSTIYMSDRDHLTVIPD